MAALTMKVKLHSVWKEETFVKIKMTAQQMKENIVSKPEQ